MFVQILVALVALALLGGFGYFLWTRIKAPKSDATLDPRFVDREATLEDLQRFFEQQEREDGK